MTARGAAVWVRGRGIALVPLEGGALGDGVAQGLRDGIERGYEGETPVLPLDARVYRIEAGKGEVGVLAVRPGWPREGDATVLAVAIDPDERGRSYGMRALVLAERTLKAEGVRRCFALVPRGNGHGMYFMLRCGYSPILGAAPVEAGDRAGAGVTWFERLEGRGRGSGTA